MLKPMSEEYQALYGQSVSLLQSMAILEEKLVRLSLVVPTLTRSNLAMCLGLMLALTTTCDKLVDFTKSCQEVYARDEQSKKEKD